jgi:hypothetical protein
VENEIHVFLRRKPGILATIREREATSISIANATPSSSDFWFAATDKKISGVASSGRTKLIFL